MRAISAFVNRLDRLIEANVQLDRYREVVTAKKNFAAPGAKIRGQEFHYSEIDGSTSSKRIRTAYVVKGTHGTKPSAGFCYRNCPAGYVHLHFGSNPAFARSFVAACRDAEF